MADAGDCAPRTRKSLLPQSLLPHFGLPRFSLAIALIMAASLSLHGQQAKPTEYQVKAAYLYNFGKFVEWPAEANTANSDSFPVCILGHDPFGPSLDAALAGEKIDGKNVAARRISKAQEAGECRIVFVSSSEAGQLKDILAALGKSPVLTVSDIPQFASRGGMIEFVLAENKVRFTINLTAAEDAGLTLSSELLKVAVAVLKNPKPGPA